MDATTSLILAGALVIAVTGIVNRIRPASEYAPRSSRRSRSSGCERSCGSGDGGSHAGGDCGGWDGVSGDCGGGDGGGGD